MSTTLPPPPARADSAGSVEPAGAAVEARRPASSSRVALVTGASSGIGRAAAERLARGGWRVYGGSRRVPDGSPSFVPLTLDVDDDASVAECVGRVLREEGRIDLLVNGAGFGIAGAVEDTSLGEARAQFETNFFGVVRVVQAVLPAMRERGGGMILNVSSIAGLVGMPFQGFYAASKFALEGLTESLRMELRPFGIRVVLVEPGDTVTPFRRERTAATGSRSAYHEYCHRVLTLTEAEEARGIHPDTVARLIERVAAERSPRLRYSAGPLLQRLTPTIRAVLPHRLYEWIFCSHFKL